MRSARTIADFLGTRDNNFNLIRFVAATAVLVSHCWPLSHGPDVGDPLYVATGQTFGTLAVEVFFFTSGFLVTGSLLNRGSALDFARARALRVFPGLIVSVIVTAVALGLLFAKTSFADYFFSKAAMGFIFKNSTFLIGGFNDLPGVFRDIPYPDSVNGSLWTLPREIRMYFLLGVFWLVAVRLLRKWPRAFDVIVFAAAIGAVAVHFVQHFATPVANNPTLFGMFFLGSCAYTLRAQIRLSGLACLACGAALVASVLNPNAFFVVHNLVLGYIVLWMAFVPAGLVRRFNAFGDYSYGVYIYAFPVQQAVAALAPGVSVGGMFLRAFPVTLALAIASWHFVEERALRLKERRCWFGGVLTSRKSQSA